MTEFEDPHSRAIPDRLGESWRDVSLPHAQRSMLGLLSALDQAAHALPTALHLQTDRLTGMYLKNLLFSAEGRALIDATVPGPKRFVLLDCQHAGAANSHGAGEKIDRYFESLRGIFQRAALEVGIPHVPMRLGGDEFALVVPADERATQFLKRIVVEVEKSRGEHVGPGSNELGSYVVERDTMRTIRNDYRREVQLHHDQFTARGFFDYMRDTFVPRGPDPLLSRSGFDEYLQIRGLTRMLAVLRQNPAQEDLAVALEAGYLQKYITGALITGMTAPAGRFSMSSVEIGATPRWEDYHLAEGVASKRIQATKDKVFTVDIEPALSVNPSFVVKLHESEACRAFVEREEAYARLWSALEGEGADLESRAAGLYKLVMLAVSDPNLPGVLRGDLVREIPSEVVLGCCHEGPISALAVNVRSFGVVNNSKSYTDADRMLADVVSAAATEFSPLAVVRQGGGRVVLIGNGSLELDDVARIRAVLEGRVKEHIKSDPAAYQRMLVEYGERYALNSRWSSGQFTPPPLDFGTCGVSIAMIHTDSGAPLDLGNM